MSIQATTVVLTSYRQVYTSFTVTGATVLIMLLYMRVGGATPGGCV
jgi:hypothetical protein